MDRRPQIAILVLVFYAALLGWYVQSNPDWDLDRRRKETDERREALLAKGLYDEDGYTRMVAAQEGQWLYHYPERGQTYEEFVADGPLIKGVDGRDVIVLQPLSPLSPHVQRSLESVRAFTEEFFRIKTIVAEPIDLPNEIYDTERQQYDASRLLEFLDERRPENALVYAGIADLDFYADDHTFVFGLGWLRKGIGAYSMTRLRVPKTLEKSRFRKRIFQLLNHEIGHTFGLDHCIYFRCSMNGANSIAEADDAPLHFCPVCLQKLAYCLKFDVLRRYEGLKGFYAWVGFKLEAEWVRGRIAHLEKSDRKVPWKE